MSEDNTLFQQIEDYLSNSLNQAERVSFEAKLSQDADLQHQVEMTRHTHLALKRHKMYALKDITQTIDREEKQKAKTKKIVAGSIALIAVTASIVYVSLSDKETAPTPILMTPAASTSSIQKPAPAVPSTLITPLEQGQNPRPSSTEKPKAVAPLTGSSSSASADKSPFNEEQLVAPVSTLKEAPIQTPAPQALQEEKEKKAVDPCANTHLEAYVATEKTCVQQQSGRIQVSAFKGGKAPYRFHIYDEAKHAVATTHLGKGKYSVVISDADNCSSTLQNVEIKEENCQKDFELNAVNGEVFDLGPAEQAGTLSIVDKGGVMHYHKQLAKGETISWDGSSTKGEAQVGYFIFVVQYEDGNVRRGSITVIR